MDELKQLICEKETESLVLKWAGEEDVKVYLAELEEKRRFSLRMRNNEGLHHREIDRDKRIKELEENAEDERLKAACKCSFKLPCIWYHDGYHLYLIFF